MTKASQKFACTVCFGLAFTIGGAEDLAQLTLQEAHETAIRNHPQIIVADLKTLAARQVTREVRSAFFPALSASVMSVGTADENTRLGAIGSLSAPPPPAAPRREQAKLGRRSRTRPGRRNWCGCT